MSGSTQIPLTKRATTVKEQVQKFRDRQLIINNDQVAEEFLERVSYYRLSGYFRQFYKHDEYEVFCQGTKFEQVTNLYLFDAELRMLLFGLIREIEISFKTHLGNKLACDHGELVWKNRSIYHSKVFVDKKTGVETLYFDTLQENLSRKISRAKKEIFIQHHINAYSGQFPVWVLMEIIDFADASKIYKNLKTEIKKDMKRKFYKDISHLQLESWLEQIVKCRNICAHHGRIVGKENFKLKQHSEIKRHNAKGFFALLIVLKLISNQPLMWEDFLKKLELLIRKYEIDLEMVALPDDWKLILK